MKKKFEIVVTSYDEYDDVDIVQRYSVRAESEESVRGTRVYQDVIMRLYNDYDDSAMIKIVEAQ